MTKRHFVNSPAAFGKTKNSSKKYFAEHRHHFHEKHKKIGPGDCCAMVLSRKCEDQALKKIRNVWSLHADPVKERFKNSVSTFMPLRGLVNNAATSFGTCPKINVTGESRKRSEVGLCHTPAKNICVERRPRHKQPCEPRLNTSDGHLYNGSGVLTV